MGIQICAILFVFGWTVCIFTPFCYILKFLNWLRIDAIEEEVGMDISRHKGSAYQSEASNQEAVAELNASRRKIVLDKKVEPASPADDNLGGSEHAREEAEEAA
jgi:Amt family ammonium transporter